MLLTEMQMLQVLLIEGRDHKVIARHKGKVVLFANEHYQPPIEILNSDAFRTWVTVVVLEEKENVFIVRLGFADEVRIKITIALIPEIKSLCAECLKLFNQAYALWNAWKSHVEKRIGSPLNGLKWLCPNCWAYATERSGGVDVKVRCDSCGQQTTNPPRAREAEIHRMKPSWLDIEPREAEYTEAFRDVVETQVDDLRDALKNPSLPHVPEGLSGPPLREYLVRLVEDEDTTLPSGLLKSLSG